MKIRVFIEEWDGYEYNEIEHVQRCTCDNVGRALQMYETYLKKYIDAGNDVRLSYEFLNHLQ